MNRDWTFLSPILVEALGDTLYMVSVSMLVGGVVGCSSGSGSTSHGRGTCSRTVPSSLCSTCSSTSSDPSRFIIFLAAIAPVTREVMGSTLGTTAVIFPMSIVAAFAFSRIVEQNLVALDPGVIEAARAMGASRLRIIWSVLIPEALAPLVLGYTFLFVGVIDMSAMAGLVGGGGLGDFAIRYGYQKFNWEVTFVSLGVIIVIVQLAQLLGNRLARKALHR